MLINELSKRSGISIHTIRFYEKCGLLKGKRDESITSNKYNHYDEESVEKLEFINDAKSVGFTIKEIGEIVDAWYHKQFSKKEKIAILEDKLVFLDQKIKDIKQMKKLIGQYKEDINNNLC